MVRLERDPVALERVQRSWTPPCLRVPVAARDLSAITRFVGDIEVVLSRRKTSHAVLVRVLEREPTPETSCRLDLPVWAMEAARVFHANPQVWVHVDYTRYRQAYLRAHPNLDLSAVVVDHVENRRGARVLGWQYLRLCHVARGVNSSSGQGAERLGVEYAMMPSGAPIQRGNIRYADVGDLAKMLGIKMGGVPLNGLRDALDLFEPRAGWQHRGPCRCDEV